MDCPLHNQVLTCAQSGKSSCRYECLRTKFISIFLIYPPKLPGNGLVNLEFPAHFPKSGGDFKKSAEIPEISQKKVQSPENFEVGNLLRKHSIAMNTSGDWTSDNIL